MPRHYQHGRIFSEGGASKMSQYHSVGAELMRRATIPGRAVRKESALIAFLLMSPTMNSVCKTTREKPLEESAGRWFDSENHPKSPE